jgi:hypothetical protein
LTKQWDKSQHNQRLTRAGTRVAPTYEHGGGKGVGIRGVIYAAVESKEPNTKTLRNIFETFFSYLIILIVYSLFFLLLTIYSVSLEEEKKHLK